MSEDTTTRELAGDEPSNADLLDGYPGAALLVDPDCSIISANAKGASLDALLQRGALPEIPAIVAQAAQERRIATGTVSLEGRKGKVILEVTVTPQGDKETFLVLAKDLTMERNLRSTLVESRQRYKDLVEISSNFSWEIGPEGTFAFVSPRGALGYTAEEMVEHRPEEFVVDPEEYSPLPFESDRHIENVEMWMRRADGSTACVIISCLPLTTEDGEWRGARGICRDVTEEREREAALNRAHHREQLLNHIVSTIRDEVEPNNMLTAAASASARALGASGCTIFRQEEPGVFTAAAEYGKNDGLDELNEYLKKLEGDGAIQEVKIGNWQVLAASTHYRKDINGAISMWKASDEGAWDDESRILIADVANQLGIANEQISNHERIVKLSRTDGLTGLLNRRAFYEEELPRRLARLERSKETAALFYVDLDNFKCVNDVHGHQRGDEALLFIRDMLMEFSRPGDVISRMGGDEFAMWLDGICEKVVTERIEKLIDASKSLHQFSGDEETPLGLSVGIAMYDPAIGESIDELLARGDEAMYAVKRAGKGGYKIAPPPGSKTEKSNNNPPSET